MADEVNQLPGRSWKNFLESFQNQGVDQQMIHRREVRSQSHVVEIVVCFGCSQWSVNQLTIIARQWNVPPFELSLQNFELRSGQVVSETSRTAVRKERHVTVL